MPYEIRSKGMTVRLRDGRGKSDPVRVVGGDWVLFQNLPSGHYVEDDPELEINYVELKEEPKEEPKEEAPKSAPRKRRSKKASE